MSATSLYSTRSTKKVVLETCIYISSWWHFLDCQCERILGCACIGCPRRTTRMPYDPAGYRRLRSFFLHLIIIRRVWNRFGPLWHGCMANTLFAERVPEVRARAGKSLPLFARFACPGALGVDSLAQTLADIQRTYCYCTRPKAWWEYSFNSCLSAAG